MLNDEQNVRLLVTYMLQDYEKNHGVISPNQKERFLSFYETYISKGLLIPENKLPNKGV